MELLLEFFKQHGLGLTLIAIVGIILLGVLKYNNLFSKIKEENRHYIYLSISVSSSVIGSVIYLACIDALDATYVLALAGALYVLNQAFYNIFKTFSLNDLLKTIIEKLRGVISDLIEKNKNK